MRAMLVVLFSLALLTVAWAEVKPDQRPFLRIEAGMHTAAIKRIGLSADGKLLATGADDKTVRLWALPAGRLIRTFRLPMDAGNGGKVYAVALSKDGKTVAAGGWGVKHEFDGDPNFVYVFDTQSGALLRRLGPLSTSVNHLRFSSDDRHLVAGLNGSNGIRVWASSTGKEISVDKNYGGSVYGADFADDGRLATTSQDGYIRLYDAKFSLLNKNKSPGGNLPFAIAFAPNSSVLAVGYQDTTRVDVISTSNLKLLYSTDTAGINSGSLDSVAWSADGNNLLAGGVYWGDGQTPIFLWGARGKGKRELLGGAQATVFDLLPYSEGIAFGSADPAFGLFANADAPHFVRGPVTADMRLKLRQDFTISTNAQQVRFGLGIGGIEPWLFNLAGLEFNESTSAPDGFHAAKIASLPVIGWENSSDITLGKIALKLDANEFSQSLAIEPDKSGLFLGTEWNLRHFDAKGREVWKLPTPGATWGVNLSSDGKIAVAAYGDGTIRWHRTYDGTEMLALFVHRPDKRWALWTPSGYYAASPGGEDLIGWHLNGKTLDDPVDFFPASRFRDRFYRPDIVKLMLTTLDEAQAVKQANKASGRKAEKPFSRKILPPVIGISADPRGLETDAAEVDIDYLLRAPSGRKVSKIEVRVDGRLFATETAEELVNPSAKTSRSLKVPLPKRDAEVSVVAFHDDQAGEPARIKVRYTGAPAPTAKTTLRALLVGVSAYNNKDLTLNYADNDASDLARVLKEQEGRFFQKVETTVLLDGDANEANIQAALADLAAKTGPDDYAVVFLAGHGLTDKNRFYFVPADAIVAEGKLTDVKTAVAETAILKALSSMRGKVLFFIDACFSAGVIKVDSTGFVNAITSEENAVMMYSSSQGDEESLEGPEWENGAFTEALMQIFADPKSYNSNGEINTDDLAKKLKERVQALTNNQQTPVGQPSRAISPFPVMGL